MNTGTKRELIWKGTSVSTGIFKYPVKGSVMVGTLNLEGDEQANRASHGGTKKAVYVYPLEHYEFWHLELPDVEFPYGVFGENLTTQGLVEAAVRVGDRFAAGTAELIVTAPRLPCYKLNIRFGREDMDKRFLASRRFGFYCAVAKEGIVKAGDPILILNRNSTAPTIADLSKANQAES